MKESQIERKLFERIKEIGGLCWKFTSPGTTGVPDRIIVLPMGHIAFVETKSTGDMERPQQKFRHQQLRRLGCQVFSTVDSYEKVDEVIRWAKEAMDYQV